MSRVQSVTRKGGLHVDLSAIAAVPDRDHYRPLFAPWTMPEWQEKLGGTSLRTLVTFDRRYILYNALTQVLRAVPGHIAEAGVYQGGTAKLFAQVSKGTGRKLFLFDTFGGMPKTDAAMDLHNEGDFSNTSHAAVKAYLADYGSAVQLHPGFIPQTLDAVADVEFCFVHIDLDIYRSISDASQFFYPRMNPGGVIVYDDYGFSSCPGARRSVDDFYADKPDSPIVLPTGQAVVIKVQRGAVPENT